MGQGNILCIIHMLDYWSSLGVAALKIRLGEGRWRATECMVSYFPPSSKQSFPFTYLKGCTLTQHHFLTRIRVLSKHVNWPTSPISKLSWQCARDLYKSSPKLFDSPHLKKNDAPGHISRVVDLVGRRVPLSQGAPPAQVAETDGGAAEVRSMWIISLLYIFHVSFESFLFS